ncbi:GFA family protein [Sphingomonas sp.]|uniref:GFA family protein n=1 Tax=Sphingomonas sp. TaxID=28214 RepID=UPI003B008C16
MSEAVAGGCHCGAVRFEAVLVDGFDAPTRCNCSICRRLGAVVVVAHEDDVRVTRGADRLSCYRFNTDVAEHFFCATCGVYTHHRRRSHPDQFSVNVACIDGASPFDFAQVPVFDGVHHTRDGHERRLAGTLRYEAET